MARSLAWLHILFVMSYSVTSCCMPVMQMWVKSYFPFCVVDMLVMFNELIILTTKE